MKHRALNQWLWKWHCIAGLIALPFVLVLAITGAIYLFNPEVEDKAIETQQTISVSNTPTITYQKQWDIAKQHMAKAPNAMLLSTATDKSTEFISGRFSHKNSVFVNPYTAKISGHFSPKDTWMYSIRKLHGELLGGKIGTKIVELIASWMVVLILTGLYVWFPFKRGVKGVFTVRCKQGKRILFRDIHAVTGFWISLLLLMVLAGGFPWTDIVGENFKTLQKLTNTGYPATWNGRGLTSTLTKTPLSLDEMVTIAKAQDLPGEITIGLPLKPNSTFSVANKNFPLETQQKLHFDRYSGKLIKTHDWSDVGVLMRGRMWLMAFHQGQFGGWNWWLMFAIAIALTVMSASALLSYVLRKQKGQWSIPKAPAQFKVGKGILILLIILGIVFPLFGISVILITLSERLQYFKRA